MAFTKWTNTSVFMVPTLGIKKESLDENNCINAFCSDIKRDVQYENAVYLLFKPTDLDRFKVFLDDERHRTNTLIDDYDYKGGYVVLVYQLNSDWSKDFALIRKGKYSETSDRFQQTFPKVRKMIVDGKHNDQISLQWRIFKKTEDMREFWENDEKWGSGVRFTQDMEVWPMWNEAKEILNINNIKNE